MTTEVTFYTDGSTAPGNPGPSGYGFYGTDELGNVYVGYGPVGILATNNAAELTATITALEKGLEIESKPNVTILSDSQYVIHGAKLIDTFAKKSWKTSTGQEIKNIELWKTLYEKVCAYRKQKQTLTFTWVKGHSGVVGNEKADTYADMGRGLCHTPNAEHYYSVTLRDETLSIEEVAAATVNIKSAKVKVKSSKSKVAPLNPRLCGKKWFFKTNDTAQTDGFYFYVTSKYEKPANAVQMRNKNLGKPNADASICLLLSVDPIPALDGLRDRFNAEFPDGQLPVVIDINGLTKKAVWEEICENGHTNTVIKRTTALSPGKIHLGEVLVKPLLVFKFEEDVTRIGQLLNNYRTKSPQIVVKDITNVILNTSPKGVQTISSALAQGQQGLIIPPTLIFENIQNEIKLNVGIDIPVRNAISGILKTTQLPVTIELLLFEVTAHSFRVASVIKVDNDMIIMLAPESSLKFIKG